MIKKFTISMDIKQSKTLIPLNEPEWLSMINGFKYHMDSDGPMKFSITHSSSLEDIIYKFSKVTDIGKEWRWSNMAMVTYNFMGATDMEGNKVYSEGMIAPANSDIHIGIKDDNFKDLAILYNTALTVLPIVTNWFMGSYEFRRDVYKQASLSHLNYIDENDVKDIFYDSDYKDKNKFITFSKLPKMVLTIRINELIPQWVLPFINVFLKIVENHIKLGYSPKIYPLSSLKSHVMYYLRRDKSIDNNRNTNIKFVPGHELFLNDKISNKTFNDLYDMLNDYAIETNEDNLYFTNQTKLLIKNDRRYLRNLDLKLLWKPFDVSYKDLEAEYKKLIY